MSEAAVRFQVISEADEAWVTRLFAGDEAQYWVHDNAYWLDNSRRLSDVQARLIFAAAKAEPVGFIAYGQHYTDEALSERVPGVYEVIHTVIDASEQRRGYGRAATVQAIAELQAQPDCHEIVIAHNPQNQPARALYESLGFREYSRNYDGDPLMRLNLKEKS